MAMMKDQVCNNCGKPFTGIVSVRVFEDVLCSKCYTQKIKNAKRKWLNQRRLGKTLKQRIAWIGEFIYENKDKIGVVEKEDLKYG
jgi:protein-arginine kinase activator protein McsA